MNAWFILIVAISISAVAAYYSIVGLAAIFAGAVIPVIIMASVLEVGKLVSAVWLHQNWNTAHILMKTYFTTAVLILMLITSMGIFGFLSRAHIEHGSSSTQLVATVANIDQELIRTDDLILSLQNQITQIETKDTSNFDATQQKINQEQENIDRIYSRIQPDITRLETSLEIANEKIRSYREMMSTIESGDTRRIQNLLGITVDGNLGPQTRSAIAETTSRINSEIQQLETSIIELNSQISDIKSSVNQQIEESTALINQLRSRITFTDNSQVEDQVAQIKNEIFNLQTVERDLTTEKFELETKLRLYEVEIGPIKYIAEFMYGEADDQLIEKAIRWVIFLIIFVFDPLAVLLVLAAVSSMNLKETPIIKPQDSDTNAEEESLEEFFHHATPEMPQETIATENHSEKKISKPTRNIRNYRNILFGNRS